MGPNALTLVLLTVLPFPLEPQVARFQRESPRQPPRPSGITARDYLRVAEGIVKFFREHQDESGAILDPFEKKERQYATPAFACAAAALAHSGLAPELREAAERAFRWSAGQLAQKRGADHHEDFYTVLLMHAREMLEPPPDIPPFDPERGIVGDLAIVSLLDRAIGDCGAAIDRALALPLDIEKDVSVRRGVGTEAKNRLVGVGAPPLHELGQCAAFN